jgi:hypothetical protein
MNRFPVCSSFDRNLTLTLPGKLSVHSDGSPGFRAFTPREQQALSLRQVSRRFLDEVNSPRELWSFPHSMGQKSRLNAASQYAKMSRVAHQPEKDS